MFFVPLIRLALSAALPSFVCPVAHPLRRHRQQHEVRLVQGCVHVQIDQQAAARGITPCLRSLLPSPEAGNDYVSPPVLMKLEILSSSLNVEKEKRRGASLTTEAT